MKFAAVCTVLCLGLAVQARPQGAKPTVHGDPAPASHTADFKPTVHGDPQSAFGATPTVHGDPEPVRPTGDITPTFHSDPAPVETPGLRSSPRLRRRQLSSPNLNLAKRTRTLRSRSQPSPSLRHQPSPNPVKRMGVLRGLAAGGDKLTSRPQQLVTQF